MVALQCYYWPEYTVSQENKRTGALSPSLFLSLALHHSYPSPFPLHPIEGLIAYVMSLNICAALGEVRHAKAVQNVPLCTP